MRTGLVALLFGLLLGAQPPADQQQDQLAMFTVGTEPFRVLLTDSADIDGARAVLAGESTERIPVGDIRQGSAGVNTGYDWHLDPDRFTWEEYASARCNALPSDVQNGLLTDRFCPWAAKLVELRPY